MHSSEIHSGLFSPTVETVGTAPEVKRDKPDLCISKRWVTGSSARCWGSLYPPAAGAEQGHCSRRLWDRAGQQGRQVGVHISGAPAWPLPCVPGQALMERHAWGARATRMGTQGGAPRAGPLRMASSPCPRWSQLAPSSALRGLHWPLKSCSHPGGADSIRRSWPGNSTRLIAKQ